MERLFQIRVSIIITLEVKKKLDKFFRNWDFEENCFIGISVEELSRFGLSRKLPYIFRISKSAHKGFQENCLIYISDK